MYVFLLSQPDLDHAGLIGLRYGRWAADLGIGRDEVEELCAELDVARFVAIDPLTEDLLVRSLIRRDEVWKQPNVFKSAAASAAGCKSARLKAVLLAEVQRLDLSQASGDQRRTQADLLVALEPFGNPSPTPTGPRREPSARASLAAVESPEPDSRTETGNGAGHKGSRRVPQGFADGTSELRGKGKGIPVPEDLPHSPSPTPSSLAAPVPVGASPAKPEEEGIPGKRTRAAVDALVGSVRKIRPDWSTASCRRALDDLSVCERPWPEVCMAFVIVAGDPESRQPGRLAHDGDWWHAAARKCRAPAASAGRPEWCRECDERTRFLLDESGMPGHLTCPRCHPDAERARSA